MNKLERRVKGYHKYLKRLRSNFFTKEEIEILKSNPKSQVPYPNSKFQGRMIDCNVSGFKTSGSPQKDCYKVFNKKLRKQKHKIDYAREEASCDGDNEI